MTCLTAACALIVWTSVGAAGAGPLQARVELRPETREVAAVITSGGGVATDHIALKTSDRTLHPASVGRYHDSADTLALVIVMQGGELFVGNDDIELDTNAQYTGVLRDVETALDGLAFAELLSPRSTITVITYAKDARVRVPTQTVAAFAGAQLGSQKDYRGEIGNDLVAGIQLGLQTLERSQASDKLLFVLSDGNAVDNERAKIRLRELAKQAAAAHVEVEAAIHKTVVSDASEVIHLFTDRLVPADDATTIRGALGDALRPIIDRAYVTFSAATLPWDGKEHVVEIAIGDASTAPVALRFPALDGDRGSSWPLVSLIGVLSVLAGTALGALVTWRSLRRAAA